MRPLLFALVLSLGAVMPASAEDAPPNTAGTPPPASPYPPPVATATPVQPVVKPTVTPDERLDAKYVRKTCEDYADSQGFRNEAKPKAVTDCMAKFRSDLKGME